MVVVGKRITVSNSFFRYAEETGWTYMPPDEAQVGRLLLPGTPDLRYRSTEAAGGLSNGSDRS